MKPTAFSRRSSHGKNIEERNFIALYKVLIDGILGFTPQF